MNGWVGLVGWPIADVWPTKWSSVQLSVWRRTGKVRRSKISVLPLYYAANSVWGTHKINEVKTLRTANGNPNNTVLFTVNGRNDRRLSSRKWCWRCRRRSNVTSVVEYDLPDLSEAVKRRSVDVVVVFRFAHDGPQKRLAYLQQVIGVCLWRTQNQFIGLLRLNNCTLWQ